MIKNDMLKKLIVTIKQIPDEMIEWLIVFLEIELENRKENKNEME